MRSTRIFCICVGLVTACAERDAGRVGVTITIDTVGGVVHVRNAGEPPVWSLVERLSLGSAGLGDASDDQVFGQISSVVADDAGHVYVADRRALEIRVFDEDGSLVRRFGGSGAGPGEFRGLQSIAWLGDTLLALDPGNARLGLLTPSGEWLDQRPYMPLTGGGIRLHVVGPRDVYMPFVTRIGERTGFVFVRHGPGGARDTLSGDLGALGGTPAPNDLAERAQQGLVRCTHSAGRGISFYTADLAPDAFLVPAPDGLRVLAWGGEYRIALIAANGDTMRVIERDLPGRPLSDAEWADEQRMYREFLDGFEDESCDPRTLPRPAERRIILAAYFDDMHRMWVERDAGDHPAFDIFDANGALLGTLDAPVRADLIAPHIRNDRLYLVVTDSLDVEYVKVFDIRRGGSD